jgi:hypothetical protein
MEAYVRVKKERSEEDIKENEVGVDELSFSKP